MNHIAIDRKVLGGARSSLPAVRNCLANQTALIRTMLLAMVALVASCAHVSAETWTSLSGTKSVEAEMVGMWGEQVILRFSDGRRVSVPMNSLVADSRIQAQNIARRLKEQRESLSQELGAVAQAEAAAAPDPLPSPEEAPAYQPISANLPPDQAITQIQQQIRNGHAFAALFDALPPSYQKQLEEWVGLVTSKLNSTAVSSELGVVQQTADLLVTRQNWIRSFPRLRTADRSDLNQLGQVFDSLFLPLAGMLRVGLESDRVSLTAIKESSLQQWVRDRDAAIAPYLKELMDKYAGTMLTWEVKEVQDGTAKMQTSMTFGKSPPSEVVVNLKQVEGYWLPETIADGFPEWIKTQSAALTEKENGSLKLSDLLGGEAMNVQPAAPPPTRNSNSYPDEMSMGYDSQMEEQYSMGDDMSMSSGYDDGGYESYGGGYGGSGGKKDLPDPQISLEQIGTFLKTIQVFGGTLPTLTAAPDASTFHESMDQLLAPIDMMMKMAPRR